MKLLVHSLYINCLIEFQNVSLNAHKFQEFVDIYNKFGIF